MSVWAEVDAWRETEGARQNTAFVAWRCFADLLFPKLPDGSPDFRRERRFFVRAGEVMAVPHYVTGRRHRAWKHKGERAKVSYLEQHPDDTWQGVNVGHLLVLLDMWEQAGRPKKPLKAPAAPSMP